MSSDRVWCKTIRVMQAQAIVKRWLKRMRAYCYTGLERNKHALFSSARFRRLTLPLLGAERLTWRCSKRHGMARYWLHSMPVTSNKCLAVGLGALAGFICHSCGRCHDWAHKELIRNCSSPATLLKPLNASQCCYQHVLIQSHFSSGILPWWEHPAST